MGLRVGRVVGLLLLVVFVLGVVNFQVLQGSVLSGSDRVHEVTASSSQVIASALVSVLGGSISILVAVILLPVFRRVRDELAFAYLAFAVVNFVAIAIDTVSVVSVLEMSRVVSGNEGVSDGMVDLVYGRHWWTHHLYLLVSCFPVLILYSGLYLSRSVPRALALFGIVATVLMAVEVVGLLLGAGVSEWLFVPIALVQVATPLWLIVRGLRVDDSVSLSQ